MKMSHSKQMIIILKMKCVISVTLVSVNRTAKIILFSNRFLPAVNQTDSPAPLTPLVELLLLLGGSGSSNKQSNVLPQYFNFGGETTNS